MKWTGCSIGLASLPAYLLCVLAVTRSKTNGAEAGGQLDNWASGDHSGAASAKVQTERKRLTADADDADFCSPGK